MSTSALSTPLSRRSLLKAAAGAAAGLTLASFLPTSLARQAQAATDGTFTAAISFMPTSLQPSAGGNDDQTLVVRPIYDVLFQELEGTDVEFHLADQWDVSDDGLTYTVHIRDNANWSDGEPITVDDLLFSFQYSGRKYDGKTSTTYVNGQPVQFNKKDDKTLEVVLPEVYWYYRLSMCSWTPLPSHVFDNDYTKVDEQPEYFTKPGMVTSGPFTVEQINEDSIVYAARDDFYGGELDVKKLVMKTIGSGGTRQLAFENGEISYMRVTTAEDLEKYAADESTYTVYSVSESRLNYLQINPLGPVTSTLGEDARKAICLALNGQEIVDFAYGTDKLAQPANSFFTPDQEDYNPDCAGYTQDLEQAKQLAESSGLAGKTLTYIYNADRVNMEQVATVIQQELQAIGVNLQIEGLDSTTFFNRFFGGAYGTGQENTWDLGTNGWDSERGQSARQAYSYFTQGSSRLFTGFSDDLANLAKQGNSEPDAAKRKELWYQAQDDALAEYWEYPLTYTNYVMVSHKDVSGLDGSIIVPEFSQYQDIKLS